MRLPKFLSSI